MNYAFGIDVGGTSIKIGFFNEAFDLLDSFSIPTNTEQHGKYVLNDIKEVILAFLKEKNINENDVLGYGFGVPGPVVHNHILKCVNLGWKHLKIDEAFQALMGKNVVVRSGNDATLAALGEYTQMALKKDICFITLGTGVGGGIIINGKGHEGANGAGAELGHMRLNYDNPQPCTCGLSGCFETVASIRGITGIAKEVIRNSTLETTLKISKLNPKVIFDAAREGDAVGLKVLDIVSDYIGQACANIAVVVDPEEFIIGGGISNAGDILIDAVKKAYVRHAFFGVKHTEFSIAKLGNDAGMYGAAQLILDK